ncbi:MAG: PFL family protein [bacterium]|nr:PFL family protein [bacterium]
MDLSFEEILQTISMTEVEHFDIRTVTMGISLRDCAGGSVKETCSKIYNKITKCAKDHVPAARGLEENFGVKIANKRISITPIALVCDALTAEEMVEVGHTIDKAAKELGVDFVGGFSALVHKGYTKGDRAVIDSLPDVLSQTDRVCSSVNIGSTKAGINIDAVMHVAEMIKKTAAKTADNNGFGCAKLVVFCNAVEDNPFMAGAFHGVGEPECVLNVGISGPGVVLKAVQKHPDMNLQDLSEVIKQITFKITRVGELFGRKISKTLNVPFGIVDLSLAPTPEPGDSVGAILEEMGLSKVGGPGSTAALAMLNDAVKKGGLMASSHVGGMSGAFIPVSEDDIMIKRAASMDLTLEKLEAMTCVCSVGLDMIAIPGDTPASSIAALIADEAAIGMINNKTTAVRVIPVPGKSVGEMAEFGGLFGRAPVMELCTNCSEKFIKRGGLIPAPVISLTN